MREMITNLPKAALVIEFLYGIEWPAHRIDLLRVAEDNNAPVEVIQALEKLKPDEKFDSPTALEKAIYGFKRE